MSDIMEIDGSELEGGGQILRIALTMSVLKNKHIRVRNIRAGRPKPGLMEQHLKGIELMRDISDANVKGAVLNSTEIDFNPRCLKGGNFKAVVKTAGSITLLLQVALPCCLFAETNTTLELHGGTNAEMAPQLDYTTEVFRPNLEKFGATFDSDLIRRGYFPKGGGQVVFGLRAVKKIKPVHLVNQGEFKAIHGWSFVAGNFPLRMAHEMTAAATEKLKAETKAEVNIESYKEERSIAPDNCAGIILVAESTTECTLGSSALVKRSEQAAEAGKRAADSLLKSIKEGACVDEHCQDQLIVLMALADKSSRIRVGEVTMHTKTAIYVVEKFDEKKKFNIIPDGSSNIIECKKIL